MPTTLVHQTPSIVLSTQALQDLETDVLVVPVFEVDDVADVPGLDAASGGEVGRARLRGELKGKAFDLFATPLSGWKTTRALLVGVGPREQCSSDHLRRVAAAGCLAARERRLTRMAIVSRRLAISAELSAQAMVEGAVLGNFSGACYRTDDPPAWIESVVLRVDEITKAVEHSTERGRVLGECSNVARELANEPGNSLTPRVFAERAVHIGRAAGLAVDVLDEQDMASLNMGLLLGVARGSLESPRLIVLRHEPAQTAASAVLGFVGKGVTFDTGGISIKPAENMDRMKDDMSGGAAVLGAMAAISRLAAPIRCIGVIPATENMPGGQAIKPGDVLRSAEGKTVEVLNTDAEGRLILGDGVWYARHLGATHLVDIATLTGACVVALGKTTSGLFGRPEWWVDEVRRASARAGDRTWPMPVFDDYRDQLKSEIADFSNTGGRAAGAITGALFIREFTHNLPWVHMDIAGTAWAEDATAYQAKGATGVGVRTLAELALGAPSWKTSPVPDQGL